jgi:hypothetical protein
LRKCIVLGGQAGSASLRDWAAREAKGYDGSDELPTWRVVYAQITVDAVFRSGADAELAEFVTARAQTLNQRPELVDC